MVFKAEHYTSSICLYRNSGSNPARAICVRLHPAQGSGYPGDHGLFHERIDVGSGIKGVLSESPPLPPIGKEKDYE